MYGVLFACLLPFLGAVSARPQLDTRALKPVSNSQTSLRILFQNNLNTTDDVNHLPFLLLDEVQPSAASSACAAFGEKLLSKTQVTTYSDDVSKSLAYIAYSGCGRESYLIDGGLVGLARNGSLAIQSIGQNSRQAHQVLCTQSQGRGYATANNTITVKSGANTFTGFRKDRDFTFRGVPFADVAPRFEYSKLYSKQGQNVNATAYSAQCAQGGSGSEDCLYLNVDTPYIPKAGSKADLKPVMFWIHGGGFTGGNGQTDGAALASREDTVFVSIQYRLSTLGFLAVPGTDVKGNFGLADQITALQWVRQNIAAFGGDPNKITILGESAGAGSVRVLLGSPPAIGKFRAAIALSNLGGGVTLGLNGDYSTTYSSYLTVDASYAQTKSLFTQANCSQPSIADQITCLKAVPALSLVAQSTVARYPVQDGIYINTEQLIVNTKNASTAHVPVIFGILTDDGSSFVNYPKSPVADEKSGLQSILGISPDYAQQVIDSGLFPFPNTGNLTLDTFNVSARIQTDKGFRCVDQATVYAGTSSGAFPSAYYYQFERSLGGYDPNGVGVAPVSPGYPRGNPNLPYFKVHAGDITYTFGTIGAQTVRDPQDIWFAQLITGYFSEFARSLQPNPSQQYLTVRGYTQTLKATQQSGPWKPVAKNSNAGPIQHLNWPPYAGTYVDQAQCKYLNYTLDYYLNSNRG